MQLKRPPLVYVGLAGAAAAIPVAVTLSPPGLFVLLPIELIMSSILASAMMFIGVNAEITTPLAHIGIWFCASIGIFAYMVRMVHAPTTR
jgi:hypothetical protein